MKNKILIISLAAIIMAAAACTNSGKNDSSTPSGNETASENKKTEKATSESLPSDNEEITGTIAGNINLEKFIESQSKSTVTVSRFCYTIGKFEELQSQIAVKPEGAAMMVMIAMMIYQEYPMEGMKCLSAACTAPLTSKSDDPGNYKGEKMNNVSTLKRNLTDYPRLPFIYFQGANPDNGYVPSGPPYQAKMYTNPYSYNKAGDGLRIKIYVETKGADSNRPCTVKKVGNIYKATEFSSLYLAYKPLNTQ